MTEIIAPGLIFEIILKRHFSTQPHRRFVRRSKPLAHARFDFPELADRKNLSNFAINMNALKYSGLVLLAVLWFWLVSQLLRTGGVNLKNLFLAVSSGIIVFVPLWRKYGPQSSDKN